MIPLSPGNPAVEASLDEAGHCSGTVAPQASPPSAGLRLCVLGSGSSGNCSALLADSPAGRELWLIDCGLSLRRIRRSLAELGVGDLTPRGILITHLDDDHIGSLSLEALKDIPVFLHRRHLRRAEREGRLFRRTEVFDDAITLGAGLSLRATLAAHDAQGSATMRFTHEHADTVSELGYATDVGRMTPELVDHLRDVDVLAIESNYCPTMQLESNRPERLKSRIMGGKGHLSNDQCSRAVQEIAPRSHVVLLHLSRQCNTPDRAAAGHEGRGYALTVSRHDEATGWIHAPLRTGTARGRVQTMLFPA